MLLLSRKLFTLSPGRPFRRSFACLPGNVWKNGYIEIFNTRFRDGLLNGMIALELMEAKIVIEEWPKYCKAVRTHSALGYVPPAPKVIVPIDQ